MMPIDFVNYVKGGNYSNPLTFISWDSLGRKIKSRTVASCEIDDSTKRQVFTIRFQDNSELVFSVQDGHPRVIYQYSERKK